MTPASWRRGGGGLRRLRQRGGAKGEQKEEQGGAKEHVGDFLGGGSGRGRIAPFYHSATSRALARSFSVSLLSWPQAARMSRPRGVRTGLA